jgi:hypothetical protein
MPVKSTHPKKIKMKKPAVKEPGNEEEMVISPLAQKAKMPIELDEPESISVLDEKPETDPLAPEEESDEFAAEDVGLEDEIDPFGDKWEA